MRFATVLLVIFALSIPCYAVSPVAHWALDETSGTTAYDSVGNNDGDLVGDPVWGDGKVDGALEFDGNGDYVDLGNDSSLKSDLPVTMSAWINLSEIGIHNSIIHTDISTDANYGIQFKVDPLNRLSASYKDGEGAGAQDMRTRKSSILLGSDQWYHVAAVVGGYDDISLYIDGVLDDLGPYIGTGGNMAYSDGSAVIGSSTLNQYFDGLIDDVRIYDVALSGAEIQQLYGETVGFFGVSPSGGFVSSGEIGGPFTAGSKDYVLTNFGDSAIDWDVQYAATWLDVSSTGGSLAAGASETVTVSINSTADTFAEGAYSDSVIFRDITNAAEIKEHNRSVSLVIGGDVPYRFGTIQAAIDAAVDGDTIIVGPGRYVENIDMLGKAITLSSANPTDSNVVLATIIDGGKEGRVITCTSEEGDDTVIDGFFITNGYASYGGGMFNEESSPTVSNCIFSDNSADGNGGGMYNRGNSSPIVINCTFTGNSSGRGGGGMCNRFESRPTVTDCTFNDNSAEWAGGGMFNEMSSPIISNCTFSDNSAKGEHEDGLGGGIANFGSSPIVTGCTFNDNFAESGGGMFNEYESSPTVTDCSFTDNTAYEKGYGWEYDGGGGMHNREHSSPTVTNCIFSGNSAESGGGMFNENRSSPIVTNCTFIDNSVYIDDAYTSGYEAGGGMANWGWSSPTVTGCTFIDNSAVFGGGMDNWNSDTIVTNCIFSGNWAEWAGGAMDNWSGNQTVINCTFTGNSAYGVDRYVGGGGIYNNDDNNLTLTNCILWGNTASSGGNGITLANVSAINIDHCDIKGGLAGIDNKSYGVINWGIGNIDIDPEFVDADGDDDVVGTEDDDLRLQGGSPCVDSGDNSVVTEATDLDGNARIFNGVVDMGAYELFNTAPVADAGDDVGALADADCVATVMLDGVGSMDADGDELTYYWYYEDDEEPFAEGMQVEAEVGLGEHEFTLIVNDGMEDSVADTMVVTVIDDMGPEFSVVMSKLTLWPANNKMVKVTPIFTASDNCGGEVSIELVGVTCNQEIKTGKKDKDIEIKGDDIYLRATRDGKDKAGRVYTITYIASDEAGNETIAEAKVTVPHDMGKRRPRPKGRHVKHKRGRK